MNENKVIGYGHQFIDDDDIEAVTKVLKSDTLTCGETIEKFENDLCEYTGFKFCSVVNSGTAALHSALFSAYIDVNDEVIIPSITFAATANAVRYLGAVPVFCDINDSLCINIHNIERLITKNTRAIISVDYGGQLCDYMALRKLCDRYNLIFISDSCHAFGAIKKDSKIDRPDMICYSFHPVKHITTGEGGAVLTNDSNYNRRIKAFRNHGRINGNQNFLGFNYRMSEINAALGISQLKKIDTFIAYRKQIASAYFEAFASKSDILIKQTNENVWHLYVIKIKHRNKFIEHMKKNNINCVIHYKPVYKHLYYRKYQVNCPYTASIENQIISIPIYYGLSENQRNNIIAIIRMFINKEYLMEAKYE